MSVGEVVVLTLLGWNILGAVISISIFIDADYFGSGWNSHKLNPIYIYKHTNCNVFGVICLTLLVNLLCPIHTVCYWFYKLCTVGRR